MSKSLLIDRRAILIGILLLVAIVIAYSLIGCETGDATNINIGDGGFLSEEPCAAPCFQGITPGLTTEEEVTEILQGKGFLEFCETFDNTANSGLRGMRCNSSFIINFENDSSIVESVGFHPSAVITLEDVTAKYGLPDGILVNPDNLPDEDPRTVMILYYDRVRAELRLPRQESATFHLSPRLTIENIGYSNEKSYAASTRYRSPWLGFRDY